MSTYEGITAAQACELSRRPAESKEKTLKFAEVVIGNAAEKQRREETVVRFNKEAHSKEGVDFAISELSSRGYSVELKDSGDLYELTVNWCK